MTSRKSILQFSFTIILLFAVQSCLYSCPYCNQQFYNELLGKRANTLGGEELLNAIRNQSVSEENSSFIVPATINSLTDIQQPDTQDKLNLSETPAGNIDQSFRISEYLPVTLMFARIIVFGHLMS